MIRFTTGNLLEENSEALVNTVNTVGVMGKGIALMFKETFPDSFDDYAEACQRGEMRVGRVHLFDRGSLFNPRYIISFPTKKHWRNPSKMEWIVTGLENLRDVIVDRKIRSIAIPPLGSGNGKLDWEEVRARMVEILSGIQDVDIVIYEPTDRYQNVSKRRGVEKLTPARALVAELIRRYSILGIECSMLEVQKLAWFAERFIVVNKLDNVLDLQFEQNRYGPYAYRLSHLLDAIDGSYIHCAKRVPDAAPSDVVWVDYSKSDKVRAYLNSEGKSYLPALRQAEEFIDGFESPLGLELLATVDWIVNVDGADPSVGSVKNCIAAWPAGTNAASRKLKLFDDRLIQLALDRLETLSRDDVQLPKTK